MTKSNSFHKNQAVEEIKLLFSKNGKSLSREDLVNISKIFNGSINIGEDQERENKLSILSKHKTKFFKELDTIFKKYGKVLDLKDGFELEDIYNNIQLKRQNAVIKDIKKIFNINGKQLSNEDTEKITTKFLNAEVIDNNTSNSRLNQFEAMPKTNISRMLEQTFNRYGRVLNGSDANDLENMYNLSTNITVNLNDRLQRGVNRMKRALVPKVGNKIDSVRVDTQDDAYLTEIALDRQIAPPVLWGPDINMPIHKMTSNELRQHRLFYDQENQRLVDNIGDVATTIGKKSKEIPDQQIFIMSKAGRLYIGPHDNGIVHGSYLDDKPLEMAGMMKIENGKITEINNNSGHYRPDELDLYRGTKILQKRMPGIFHENCQVTNIISNQTKKIDNFIYTMEEINPLNNLPLHQQMQNIRKQEIAQYNKKIAGTFTVGLKGNLNGKGSICDVIANLSTQENEKLVKAFSKSQNFMISIKDPNDVNKSYSFNVLQLVSSIAKAQNPIAMKVLLDAGLNIDETNSNHILAQAIEHGSSNNYALAKLLVKNESTQKMMKKEYQDNENNFLYAAVGTHNLELVQEILNSEEGAELVNKPQKHFVSPLIFAQRIKRPYDEKDNKIVNLLETQNILNNAKKYSINNEDSVVRILSENPDIMKKMHNSYQYEENEFLHAAVNTGSIELVEEILKSKKGLELLNKTDREGNTPLMLAKRISTKNIYSNVSEQSIAITKLLEKKDEDITKTPIEKQGIQVKKENNSLSQPIPLFTKEDIQHSEQHQANIMIAPIVPQQIESVKLEQEDTNNTQDLTISNTPIIDDAANNDINHFIERVKQIYNNYDQSFSMEDKKTLIDIYTGESEGISNTQVKDKILEDGVTDDITIHTNSKDIYIGNQIVHELVEELAKHGKEIPLDIQEQLINNLNTENFIQDVREIYKQQGVKLTSEDLIAFKDIYASAGCSDISSEVDLTEFETNYGPLSSQLTDNFDNAYNDTINHENYIYDDNFSNEYSTPFNYDDGFSNVQEDIVLNENQIVNPLKQQTQESDSIESNIYSKIKQLLQKQGKELSNNLNTKLLNLNGHFLKIYNSSHSSNDNKKQQPEQIYKTSKESVSNQLNELQNTTEEERMVNYQAPHLKEVFTTNNASNTSSKNYDIKGNKRKGSAASTIINKFS